MDREYYLENLRKFIYYFIDLPLWAYGCRSSRREKRLFSMFEPEIASIKDGYMSLCKYTGKKPDDSEIKEVIEKSFQVRIVKESDTYTSLRMSKSKTHKYFHVKGIEHLKASVENNRPIIILTGHYGSFFIPSIAFSHLGYKVYPIARTVDRSPATPPVTRLYLTLSYRITEQRFSARYIYTDFSGKIDRDIIRLSNSAGIFWTAIDLPRRLYDHKHLPVNLFGQPSTLPSGIIKWGVKKNAIFLTAWNSVEPKGSNKFFRLLSIEEPIPENGDVNFILQTYADRLTNRVIKQPWQWMGLQVIAQYRESWGTDT